MSKIPDLSKTVKQLFIDKYGAVGGTVIDEAQKCINKVSTSTVAQLKECLKKAVEKLSTDDQIDAFVILYHFVIVG